MFFMNVAKFFKTTILIFCKSLVDGFFWTKINKSKIEMFVSCSIMVCF